jgi:hypothetical protein
MDYQFNDQTQYRVQEIAAESAQISLYPVLTSDRQRFSVMPDEQEYRTQFWFTVIVTEQDLFRFDAHALMEEIFFSVSTEFFCTEMRNCESAELARVQSYNMRRCVYSSCAVYRVAARIRL